MLREQVAQILPNSRYAYMKNQVGGCEIIGNGFLCLAISSISLARFVRMFYPSGYVLFIFHQLADDLPPTDGRSSTGWWKRFRQPVES